MSNTQAKDAKASSKEQYKCIRSVSLVANRTGIQKHCCYKNQITAALKRSGLSWHQLQIQCLLPRFGTESQVQLPKALQRKKVGVLPLLPAELQLESFLEAATLPGIESVPSTGGVRQSLSISREQHTIHLLFYFCTSTASRVTFTSLTSPPVLLLTPP